MKAYFKLLLFLFFCSNQTAFSQSNTEITVNGSLVGVSNTICQGQTLQFNHQTNGLIPSTFTWVFNGGSPNSSNQATESVQFNTSGSYQVTLNVSDSSNSLSDTVTIIVNPSPNVSLSFTDDIACITENNFPLFEGTPAGGSYSGPSVSAGVFNPNNAGVGTHGITYTYTDNNGCTSSATDSIQVVPLPSVSYNAPVDSICINSTPLNLSGGSPSGGIYSGPGVSANQFDPSSTGLGNYTLTYTYTDGNNCTASSTDNIEVLPLPSPVSYAINVGTWTIYGGDSVYTYCTSNPNNLNVSFFITSLNSATSYSINFGDGNTASGNSNTTAYSNTYSQFGFYDIILTSNASNGCSVYDTISFYTGTNPAGGISTNGNNVYCLDGNTNSVNDTFPISSNILNNPIGTQYTIEVNDGTPPTVYTTTPPLDYVHTFTSHSCNPTPPGSQFPNSFEITLTIENPCGTTGGTVAPITVSEPPVPDFTFDSIVCLNQTVSITDISNYGTSVSGTNQNISCSGGGNRIWSISPNSYNSLVSNFGIAPFGLSSIGSWVSGDSVLNIQFTQVGQYDITLYTSNVESCGFDSITKRICVEDPPSDATIGINNLNPNMCTNLPLRIFDLGADSSECTPYEYNWSFSPSAPVNIDSGSVTTKSLIANFTQADSFLITLTKSNECDSMIIDTMIYVIGQPKINMSADTFYCDSSTFTFNSNAAHLYTINDSLDENYNYNWSVSPNNGSAFISSNSTDSTPTIQLSSSGNYQIEFTATNTCGSDTAFQNVTIYDSPVLSNFVSDTVCYGSYDTLFPQVSLGSSPLSYNWGYGGMTSSDTFITVGPLDSLLNISLFIVDSVGCSTSDTIVRNVFPELLSTLSNDTALCVNDTIQLIAQGIGGSPAYSYTWSDNLSNFSGTANSIQAPGTSNVSSYYVTIGDSEGCVTHDTVNISYLSLPLADAGPVDTICPGTSSLLGGNMTNSSNSFLWTSSYSFTSSIVNPIVFPQDTTDYYLQVTDTNGCENQDTTAVLLFEPARALFDLDTNAACSSFEPVVTNNSINSSSFSWFLNGQFYSNGVTPTPSLSLINTSNTSDSIVSLQLIVNSSDLCADTIDTNITIHPIPLMNFSTNQPVCSGDTIQITNNSIGGNNYIWDINSSFPNILNPLSSAPFVTVDAFNSGSDSIYTFSGILTNSFGCSDTSDLNITFYSLPLSNFSVSTGLCGPVEVLTNNLSTGLGLSYSWTGSGGTILTPNTQNTSISYPQVNTDSSNYIVDLQITDSRGCIDLHADTVTIFATPSANFTTNPNSICADDSVVFDASLSSSNSSTTSLLDYNWSFGNGNIDSSMTSTQIFTNAGLIDSTYFNQLIVTNDFACSDTLTDSTTVFPQPIAQINVNSVTDCAPFLIDSSIVNAQQYSTANFDYIWNIIDPVNQNVLTTFNGVNSINYSILNPLDTVIIQLITTSPFGCDNDTAEVTLFTLNDPDASFTVNSTACSPATFNPSYNLPATGLNLEWFVDNTLQPNTTTNPTFSFSNSSNTADSIVNIQLIVTAGSGCSDTTNQDVIIWPKPLSDFTIVDSICPNSTANITNNAIGNNLSFDWGTSMASSLFNDSTASNPAISFDENQSNIDSTANIELIVTDSNGCADTAFNDIVIINRPIADFSLPAPQCSPAGISPVDASINTTGYNWSISPNASSSIGTSTNTPSFSLPITTNDSSVYNITLITNEDFGCTDTINLPYTVYPLPTASFSTLPDSGCAPLVTTLDANASSSNQTGVPNLTYNWSFGNGNTDSLVTSSQTFTNTGVIDSTFSNQLIVTNDFACADTIIDSITVHPDALAQINASAVVDCAPFNIDNNNLVATSYPIANGSYSWDVLDPNNFQSLGTFNGISALNYTISNPDDSILVVLNTTSLYSCNDDADTILIYTLPDPDASFTVNDTAGCNPMEFHYNSISQPNVTYEWFLDGSLVSTNPNDSLTLSNSNNQVDSTYVLELLVTINSSGCADTTNKTLTVYPQPSAAFIADTTCIGDSTNFTSTSLTGIHPLINWQWNFGNNDTSNFENPSTLFDTVGDFNIQLIVTNSKGCFDTATSIYTVRDFPIANFSIPSNCNGDTVCLGVSNALNDLSLTTAYSGIISNWNWDINADSTFEYFTQFPSHSFLNYGSLDVALEIVSEYGCADTSIQNYFVNDAPSANFSFQDDTLCGPASFIVTNNSTGIIESYLWEVFTIDSLGNSTVITTDSSSSFNNTPILQPNFWQDTAYYVSLTVSNCCGSTQLIDTFVIQPLPVVDFLIAPDSGCSPLQVNFQFNGLVSPPTDFLVLEYGDGAIDTLFPSIIPPNIILWPNPSHFYTNTGVIDSTYIITVTGFNPCGDSSATDSVIVEPNTVQAFFTPSQQVVCQGASISFQNQSVGQTNSDWCFDYDTTNNTCNVPVSSSFSPTINFSSPGQFNVALFVDNGCSYDTLVQTINILEAPNANFSFSDSICSGSAVSFTDLSTISSGFISSYQWDFGDSSSSSTNNPIHTFDTGGVYTSCLTVEASNNCLDTICRNVTILNSPLADFEVDNYCLNEQPVQFINNSLFPGSSISGTSWNFGDGNTSNIFNPAHNYSIDSTYTVSLIQTAANGCSDTVVNNAIIHPIPNAAFSINLISADSCSTPQEYAFINNSTGAINYSWYLEVNGQIDSSNLNNPSHIFNTAGIFENILVAQNQFGCADTADKNQIISSGVQAAFETDLIEGCEPIEISFNDLSIDIDSIDPIQTWEWIISNSQSVMSRNGDTSVTISNNGTYTPQLVISSVRGCTDTFSLTTPIVVHPTPIAYFTQNQINISTFSFDNQSSHQVPISSEWFFADGENSLESDPLYRFPPQLMNSDSVTNCLKITNEFGCTDSICEDLYLQEYILIVPNAFAPNRIGIGEDSHFLPEGNSLQTYHLKIFDKWGTKLFESTSLDENGIPDESWDGTFEGQLMEMGSYVWKIEAVFDDGTPWEGNLNSGGKVNKFGTVTLIE